MQSERGKRQEENRHKRKKDCRFINKTEQMETKQQQKMRRKMKEKDLEE